MNVFTCIAVVFFSWTPHAFLFTQKDTVCYHGLGCFSSKAPFKDSTRPISSIPSSPDHIRTNLILYTKDNQKDGQELDVRGLDNLNQTWTHFRNKPTKLIIHGYLDNYNIISWFTTMKDELLVHGDYNVIIVDWHHGNVPPYTQACANARIVGAQLALLFKDLQNKFNMTANQFHIIGHSLGCHVAGYAGERTPGLGRITALDPAGPFFEGTDKVVRLDATDADFVDVIHSDGNAILELGLGTLEPMGDMDFYPNLGHSQPGCKPNVIKNLLNLGLAEGVEEIVGCNHLRAVKYFMESINSQCPFMTYPCNNEDDFKASKCNTCPSEGCPSMGINARLIKPHPLTGSTKYFGTTASSVPFCQYHLVVKVTLARTSKATEERGMISVRVQGDNGTSEWLKLHKDPKVFNPGSMYESEIIVPSDFGHIRIVEFKWHHMSAALDPLKWNVLGLRHPKLHLQQVDVLMQEQGTEHNFCPNGEAVETDDILTMFLPCP